jgi:hypothetical protein
MYNRMQIQSALENPQAVPNAMLDRYQQGMQPQVLPEDAKYEELRRARMTNASMGTQALQANPSQTPTIMAQKEMEIAQLKAMLDGAMKNGALQRQVSGLPMAMGQPMPPAAPPPMQPPAAPPPQPQPQPPQEAGLAALPAQNMAQGFAPGGIVSFSNGGLNDMSNAEIDEYEARGGPSMYSVPKGVSRAGEGDVREAIYRQALMNVPTEQQAVAERRRLREEMGLGNVYKAREDRLAAREKEYEKEKEGRGLGALASSLAAFASAPRKGKIGAAAQSLQAQVQQNKALDRQFQLAMSEAKDRIEDSKIKMAEGDIDAGIKQRETALKQVSDARKMLLDAGYKDEQIKAMMERIAASERSVAERIASAEAIAVMRAEVAEKIAGMQRESGGKTDLQQLSAAWFGKLKEENAKKPKGEQVTDEQLKVAAYQEAAKMLPSGVSAAAATQRAETSKSTAETRRSQAEDEAMARVRLTPAYRKLKREKGEAAAEDYAEAEMRKRFPTSSTRGVLPYPQAGGKSNDPLGLR